MFRPKKNDEFSTWTVVNRSLFIMKILVAVERVFCRRSENSVKY